MDEEAIQKIINQAEVISMNSALEQLTKFQTEGDEMLNKKSYEKAIQIYSDAMILPNLPSGYLSMLHEKRAFSHFSLSSLKSGKLKEAHLDLALSDGEKALELNTSSWINQALSKMDEAKLHFRRALAISPGQTEVKSDFDACKMLAGKIARSDHLDPRQMPMNLSERVDHFNDETGHGISEEDFLKLGRLLPGGDHVQAGHQHLNGWGVPQSYSEAVRFYTKAAKVGNAEGMYNLAALYKDGLGVKRDIPHAIELLLEAAEKPVDITHLGIRNLKDPGVLAAQHSLGLMHEEGVGFPKDRVKAAYWYKKAADNGNGNAANNLAILYNKGEGVPLNEKMAEIYWKIAVADKNTNAAYSLHRYYLREMEPQLAKSYFNTSIELGNDRLKPFKAQVFETIEEMEKLRLESEAAIKAFEKANKLSTKGLNFKERMKREASATSPVTAKLLEDLDELRVAQNCAPQKWAGQAKKELDINELAWKAQQGSTTAANILKCIENTFYLIKMWEEGLPRGRAGIEKFVGTLYLCLTSASHHFKMPKEMFEDVLKFLDELFGKVGGEKSELDMQLRLCIPFFHFMAKGLDEYHAELLVEGIRRYSDEIPLYRDLSNIYGYIWEYRKGLEVTIKGLLKAPNDPDLLYSKAVHLRLIERRANREGEIREAYKQFIENASADHRKLPEGYYGIAMTYKFIDDMEMIRYYYGMGEDAEKAQLSCYLPYDSSIKMLLKTRLMMSKDERLKSKCDDLRLSGVTGKEIEESKLYLKDPKRIGLIRKHREMAEWIRKQNKIRHAMSQPPKFIHKIPKALSDMQTIKLVEMNPTKDMIYEGRILNLTLIEEPNFGFPSIHSIAEDDNGEAIRLYVYNVEQNEKARKTFGVGAKISVINPYLRIGSEDLINGIRVDDPKCLIHMERVEDMCRYCGKEEAKSTCSKCKKAKYCGKECQVMDWKVLKHKFICLEEKAK